MNSKNRKSIVNPEPVEDDESDLEDKFDLSEKHIIILKEAYFHPFEKHHNEE